MLTGVLQSVTLPARHLQSRQTRPGKSPYGISGLWQPSVHSDVAFLSFDVGHADMSFFLSETSSGLGVGEAQRFQAGWSSLAGLAALASLAELAALNKPGQPSLYIP